jgi:type II secretory pathway pseudopilin PulG
MPKLFQFERRAGSRRDSEDGFVLLAVLFLVVLVLIGLAVAAPKMARSIQREKELELVHRGEQYKRAIKMYYAKFGAYPTSIDQLLNTNDVKFLRKRYKDPITGKDDWRLIHFGEAKVPPMGLFGQPLGPTGQPAAATTTGAGASSAFGTTTPASTPYNFTPPPNPFGPTPNASGSDAPDAGGDAGSVTTPGESSDSESAEGSAGTTSQPATPTTPTSTGATPFGTSATGATNSPAGTPSSAFGASLSSNGPIVGVGIPSDKASMIEYKKQKQYNKWEFVYNPIEDQLMGGGLSSGAAGGVNPAGAGVGSTGTGTGSSIGTGSTFGPSSNSGASSIPNSGTSGVGGSSPMGSNPQQPQQQ